MKKTLLLARKGQGKTTPNPLVGCVIVKDNQIVGKGYHKRAGLNHAEVEALKNAGKKSKSATLYVNLEPCSHWGRTPPCVDAIIKAGIKRVVIAITDPNPLVKGKSLKKLRKKGIKVKIGILKEEAKKVNEVFFTNIKEKRPYFVLKVAQTLDGKIATSRGLSKWITSAPARKYARRLRGRYDAVLVGCNTVVKDNPWLDATQKKTTKVVLDPCLKISSGANIFKKAQDVTIFIKKGLNKKSKIARLKDKANVRELRYSKDGFFLKDILKELYSLGIMSVFVEGGGFTLGKFLDLNMADKLYVFVAPKLMGDNKALDSFAGNKRSTFDRIVELDRVEVKKIGKDYLYTGYPEFRKSP